MGSVARDIFKAIQQRTIEALDHMRDLYLQTKDLPISRNAPRLGDAEGAERAKTLTALLKEYEQQIELRERRECIKTLASSNENLNFTVELEAKQLAQVDSQLNAMQYLDGLFEHDVSPVKNAAPAEVNAIVAYARTHPDLNIGVVTPFANQRDLIQSAIDRGRIPNATCGTVHAYQGDEKDVILFSLALTDHTHPGTYKWLTENRELIN
ncbi:MAG: AAA domain-containing protein [Coriobacteriales bacterium]|nr:AAA domain-containing protein [Coriobacteriales bacterium]